MEPGNNYFYGDPSENPLEYREKCPKIDNYVKEFEAIPESLAKQYFFDNAYTDSEILPFAFRALQKVYPEVAIRVAEEWPEAETIVREIEAGGH